MKRFTFLFVFMMAWVLEVNGQTATTVKLQETLEDLVSLDRLVRQVHWNARGTAAYSLHELTGEFHAELDSQQDIFAEQLSILGVDPVVSFEKLTQNVHAVPNANQKHMRKAGIDLLIKHYQQMINQVKERMKGIDDLVVEDHFIGLRAMLELQQWKLKLEQES